jgi:hypothetical protein
MAQMAGVALVLAVLAASLLGMAGGAGPLSTTTAGDEALLQVRFQRFVHSEADETISVVVDGRLVTGDTVDLVLAHRWVDAVDVEGITPQPSEEIPTRDGLVLRLPAEPGAEVTVRINYRVNELGSLGGEVRVPGAQVSFRQFVYP